MVNRALVPAALLTCVGCAGAPQGQFEGRIAGAVIAQLKAERFFCWLERRHHVPNLERPAALRGRSRPVLFCSQWDAGGTAPCIERRYAFEVAWADPDAPDEQIVEQERTQRIVAEHYTCQPQPAPVAR